MSGSGQLPSQLTPENSAVDGGRFRGCSSFVSALAVTGISGLGRSAVDTTPARSQSGTTFDSTSVATRTRSWPEPPEIVRGQTRVRVLVAAPRLVPSPTSPPPLFRRDVSFLCLASDARYIGKVPRCLASRRVPRAKARQARFWILSAWISSRPAAANLTLETKSGRSHSPT